MVKAFCLSVGSTDNVTYNNDDDTIIFTMEDTKLYVPVVTFSTRGNQKLSKLLTKEFERSVFWNECKTKSDNKSTTNEYRFFFDSNFVGVNRLFVLIYSNEHAASKRFKVKRYYLTKEIINDHNVFINRKNIYDQAIDSDIKRFEEIRKLTTGQGEDYTTGCLLDYDYVKSHYKLIAVDLSRQKELDVDPKAIQQTELIGQLKKLDADDDVESMFILMFLEKIKEKRLKFS